MRDLELALKAVCDPTRTRIVKLLEGGGLCVCQMQAVLGFAQSTVSKHLTILKLAGLVDDRRSGKWIEYALVEESRNPHSKAVLALLRGALGRDPAILADRERLLEVRAVPLSELCSLPGASVPMPVKSRPRPGGRRDRAHA